MSESPRLTLRLEQLQPLTGRQYDCLALLIEGQLDEEPLSIRELGERMGIKSTNGVNDHLKALERKGYIVRLGAGVARRARVTHYPDGRLFPTMRELLEENAALSAQLEDLRDIPRPYG